MNRKFCPYTVVNRSEKTRTLPYFTQCKSDCESKTFVKLAPEIQTIEFKRTKIDLAIVSKRFHLSRSVIQRKQFLFY